MRQVTAVMLLFVPALCLGSARFLLDSELRTDYTDGASTNQFLTGYSYDVSGNRVQTRVWSGTDTTVAPGSISKFTYDTSGIITKELLLSGADTSSIVNYAYTGGKLIAIHTLAKDGALRFTDSLLYDGQGNVIEEQRISSAGVKTFFHRYALNAQGKTVADSMYELVSGSYLASQAYIYVYNADSTVASETQWRLSSDSWDCISTAFMRYAARSLISVATHERDGSGTLMTDSLAYTYDVNGNRTKEEKFDGASTMVQRIVYSWRDTQPNSVLMNSKRFGDERLFMGNRQGRLSVDYGFRNQGEISIFDMTGKRLCRVAVGHSGIVALQGIGKGSYIAVFISGSSRRVMNFTQYN